MRALRLFVAAITVACMTPATHAEIWAPLETIVQDSAVIVKAKAVSDHHGWIEFAITEVWVGDKDLLTLNDRGMYVSTQGSAGVHVVTGQEIIFFFSKKDIRGNGKVLYHGCSFPIHDDKLVYGESSEDQYRQYTVGEFKENVLEYAKNRAEG